MGRAPGSMDRRTRALVFNASAPAVVSLVGYVLCLIFQWPSQFVLGTVARSRVTAADIVTGTVLSPPLVPWVVLVLCAVLARSGRWWGTVATIVLSLLGVVFTIGGWGEAFGPPNPYVPRAVLLVGGVLWMALGLSLAIAGVRALLARLRGARASTSAREISL